MVGAHLLQSLENPGPLVHSIVYWQAVPLHICCHYLDYCRYLPERKVFSKKKIITCFAATNRVTRGKFDRIQVASSDKPVGFAKFPDMSGKILTSGNPTLPVFSLDIHHRLLKKF